MEKKKNCFYDRDSFVKRLDIEKIQEIGYDFILPSILLYNYTIEEIEEILIRAYK